MIKSLIGKRIREMRTARGYSQEKFAAVSGLDRTYIAGVELGKRNISIENLNKIAEALNLTLAELCDVETAPHRSILLTIDGERFLLQSKSELTPEIKEEIEILCRCAFDEDEENPFISAMDDEQSIDVLYDQSPYEMAYLFKQVIKNHLGLDVEFKALDLEVAINK